MTDTQWPRYIVLHQDREGNPHRYAGSVHAPDAEMALLNARDVFVRRPECVSLWVVRANQVFSLTAEEIEEGQSPAFLEDHEPERAATKGEAETYHLFQKIGHKALHQHVGDVEAESAKDAMQRALDAFKNVNATVWWVFPASAVKRSRPEDIEDLFAIAETK